MAEGSPQLHVLDTTDEQTITTAAARMNPERSWFLVASKSGGTVEVASMERFFWSQIQAALGDRAGRQFVAITDPGTALEALAASRGYREVFVNPADIGGRFSALSLFGLVPTALIGRSAARSASRRRDAWPTGCRQENAINPGLELGAFIGAAASNGRDKLTVLLPPSLAIARPVDRAADRREHRQARQGGAAGRGRAARAVRTSTAPTAPSW